MSDGFIADACALIAFHNVVPPRLSARAIEAMRAPGTVVSAVTIWEITRKVAIGKLPPPPGLNERGFSAFLRERGYSLLPLSPEAAERANALPPYHADPMDRLLIAQALLDRLTVLTSDRSFVRYGVPTLW